MTLIDNYLNNIKSQTKISTPETPTIPVKTEQLPNITGEHSEIRDEFVKIKKNNGLVRKFYNF